MSAGGVGVAAPPAPPEPVVAPEARPATGMDWSACSSATPAMPSTAGGGDVSAVGGKRKRPAVVAPSCLPAHAMLHSVGGNTGYLHW